jgi:acyl-coenzyme A synthetase/AMP-(fatty) acid ligase
VLGWFDRAERSIEPAKPFVVGPRTLTYGGLIDRTRRLSTLFRELGLRQDDRALIATDDDIATVCIFLALLRNGITAVVLDPQASGPELKTLIRTADAKALFMDGAVIARGAAEAGKRADAALVQISEDADARESLFWRLTRGLRAGRPAPAGPTYPAVLHDMPPAKELPSDVPEETLAYILFTSGTLSPPSQPKHSSPSAKFLIPRQASSTSTPARPNT